LHVAKEDIPYLLSIMAGFDSTLGGGFYVAANKLIDNFYNAHYKDKMYKMELILKLTKQKVVAHKSKIAIPHKYVFICGVLLMLAGIGSIILSRRKSGKEYLRG
jgi:hypothetical protein